MMRSSPSSPPPRSTTAFSEDEEETQNDETLETRTPETGTLQGLNSSLDVQAVTELLCQALETEIGGVQIYRTAIKCAENNELREEWSKYLEETENHERILREVFEKLELDPETPTPGRTVVKQNGEALVQAMETCLSEGNRSVAQICAAECVVLAETKDHLNWELIGEVAKKFSGDGGRALKEAYEEIEEQEDEHLYHTRGWARELWLESFGLPAALPPPEEEKKVKSEIGAARAKNARRDYVRSPKSSQGRRKTMDRKGAKNQGKKGRRVAAAKVGGGKGPRRR